MDAVGQAWDEGATLLLGLVPSTDPPGPWPSLREVARPAMELANRLGLGKSALAEHAVPTPGCGLAGATPRWARRALALVRDTGRAFVEPPEGW